MLSSVNKYFAAIVFLASSTTLLGQSIGTTSSSGSCVGGSSVFWLQGGSNCGSPTISSEFQWTVTPATGRTITFNPNSPLNINVQWTAAGTYTVSASYGCNSGSSGTAYYYNFTVGAAVSPGVSISGPSSICEGQSASFTATPTNGGSTPTYVWYKNGNQVSGQTTSTYNTSSLASGDIVTARINSSLLCANNPSPLSNPITVTVNYPQSATLSGPSHDLCPSGVYVTGSIAFQRTPEANVTYLLYRNGSPTGLSPVNQGGYSVWSIDQTGTYELKANFAGCAETVVGGPISVNSTSPGAVTASVSPNTYVTPACPGTPFTLTASGGSNYTWTGIPSSEIIPNGSPVTVNPTVTTTYRVTGQESTCLTSTYSEVNAYINTTTVSQVGAPSPSGGNVNFCQGGGATEFSISATSNATGGYAWSVNDQNALSGEITTSSGGTVATIPWASGFAGTVNITVTAYGPCNSSTTANTTVNVKPIPLTSTLNGPAYLCPSGTYSSSAIVFTRTPEAGVTYSLYLNGSPTGWSPTNQGGGYPTWTTSQTGTYSLRANFAGCAETVVGGPVTVNSASPSAINASISPNTYVTPVCPGTQFTLSASGGINYTWTSIPSPETIPNGSPVTVNPNVTTTYRVTGLESTCLTSVFSEVNAYINTTTVSQVGSPSTSGGNISFCQGGGSTEFSISPASNATGGYTWSINDQNALSGPITTNGAGTVATIPWASGFSGPAMITVTAHGPCNSSTTSGVNVNIKPYPLKDNLVGSESLCIGKTTDVVLSQAPQGEVTYSLLLDGTPTGFSYSQIPGIGYMRWTVSQTGVYSVQANFTGCPAVEMDNTLTIAEEPKQYLSGTITTDPFSYPPIYCVNEIDFKATSSHSGTFTWFRNGEPILTSQSGVTTSIYDPVTFNSNNDVLKVRINAQPGYCLYSDELEVTLDGSFFKIGLDVALNSTSISVVGMPNRCEGVGETMFFAVANNAKNFQWTINPTSAGSIVPSGTHNATATVIWNPAFADIVTIEAMASGCNNTSDDAEYIYTVHPLPNVPAPSTLNYCDFEQVVLKGAGGSDITNHNWFTQSSSALGTGFQLPLDVKKSGTYIYQYEPISQYGCVNPDKASLTVQVGIGSACDDKLNWIESVGYNYTWNGSAWVQSEISHSKAFFDLTGRGLQSQTKNFTSGQIFTAHTINDSFERPALATLSVPMDQTNFSYKHWIALDQQGGLYDFTDLGEPFAAEPGTVGWYYSAVNTTSEAPKTVYPFSQTDYYTDGTGEVRRSSAPGEVLRMGQGKETWSGTFPVYSELNDYLLRRSGTDIGLPDLQEDNTLAGEGLQTVARDQNGRFVVSIADKGGKAVMSARPGSAAPTEHVLEVNNSIVADETDEKKLTYFYLLEPAAVTITPIAGAEYVMHNLITDATALHFQDANNENKWPAGFYRMVVTEGQVTLTYTNYFQDVSYQFYDDAGRLKTSVSPNGYKRWKEGLQYSLIDKTTYVYNHQGWLLSMTEPDAGTTRYVYRKDGKIRFSQNAEQLTTGKYSYTHYDLLGRPVESGEYDGVGVPFVPMTDSQFGSSAMKVELEKLASHVTWTGVRKDWVKTFYDFGDTQFSAQTGLTGFVQDYIRGAVSYTQNENNKTWYSYDELGRVTWLAQKPAGLSTTQARAFVTQYTYDYLGNVLSTSTRMYVNGTEATSTAFYHHYSYDADKRLVKVETSPDGNNKKTRAEYEYYLHGPLKRIELGETIQGIDFVYNIHGWLTQINHPENAQDPGDDGQAGVHADFKPDAFGMVLDYYENTLANVFAASLSPKLLNPDLFHGLPERNDPVVASNFESLYSLSQMDWKSIAKESFLRNEATLSNMVSPNK
jgi:predicted secreted protein